MRVTTGLLAGHTSKMRLKRPINRDSDPVLEPLALLFSVGQTCFDWILCRDGEEVTFVSERDGNLELYQQQLGKERRSVGEEAAEGDLEASVQHRAAPKRLTNAISMQVRLHRSGVTLIGLGAAAKLGQDESHAGGFLPSTASWSTVGAASSLYQSV